MSSETTDSVERCSLGISTTLNANFMEKKHVKIPWHSNSHKILHVNLVFPYFNFFILILLPFLVNITPNSNENILNKNLNDMNFKYLWFETR